MRQPGGRVPHHVRVSWAFTHVVLGWAIWFDESADIFSPHRDSISDGEPADDPDSSGFGGSSRLEVPFVPEIRYSLQPASLRCDEALPPARALSPLVPSEVIASSNTGDIQVRLTKSRPLERPLVSCSGSDWIGLHPKSPQHKQRGPLQTVGETSSEEWTDDEEFYSRSARQKHRQQRLIERQKKAAVELPAPFDPCISPEGAPSDDPKDNGPLSPAFQRRVAAAARRSPRASRFQINASLATPSQTSRIHRHTASRADSVIGSPDVKGGEVLPPTRGYESGASDADIEDGDID